MLQQNQTTDTLKAVGEALYGKQWQTSLARDLGFKDGRRMRQFMSKERPVPAGVWDDLLDLVRERKMILSQLPCFDFMRPIEKPCNPIIGKLQRTLSLNASSELETDPEGYFAFRGAMLHIKECVMHLKAFTPKDLPKAEFDELIKQLETLKHYEWL